MYLLGICDHYTSHTYVTFSWRGYVSFVKNFWAGDIVDSDNEEVSPEKVAISKDQAGTFIANSAVDDYRYRPLIYENVSLYKWVQCSNKKARSKKELEKLREELLISKLFSARRSSVLSEESPSEDSELEWEDSDRASESGSSSDLSNRHPVTYPFLPRHPRFMTHAASCDFRKMGTIIPNFIGGALPRADKGDRSYYCMTMLTIFKPWRSPGDLKDGVSTWDQAFSVYSFSDRQKDLQNFNVRYECNDARDDHYAQLKK
ncbi:hypothetical protein C8F04DRAFT_873449, partial [Mycena alexandri]